LTWTRWSLIAFIDIYRRHLCITSLAGISYCRANWTDQFLS